MKETLKSLKIELPLKYKAKKKKLENELNDIHKKKIQGAYIRSLKLIGLNMTEMYILLS